MSMFSDPNPPSNTQLDSMEDLPEDEIKRTDGLVTKEDIAKLMGKSEKPEGDEKITDDDMKEIESVTQDKQGRTVIALELSSEVTPEKLADFIKKIMDIGQ